MKRTGAYTVKRFDRFERRYSWVGEFEPQRPNYEHAERAYGGSKRWVQVDAGIKGTPVLARELVIGNRVPINSSEVFGVP